MSCCIHLPVSAKTCQTKRVCFSASSCTSSVLIHEEGTRGIVALGTPLSGLIKHLESIRDLRVASRSLFNRARITSPCTLLAWGEKCAGRKRDNRLRKINRRKYRDYSTFCRVLPLSRHTTRYSDSGQMQNYPCRGNFGLVPENASHEEALRAESLKVNSANFWQRNAEKVTTYTFWSRKHILHISPC